MRPVVGLPKYRTGWEIAVSDALEDDLPADLPRTAKDPWTCPVSLLPYLAAERSVDGWSPLWPEALRRQVVADSWRTHRKKGTPAAMDAAVQGLGLGATWSEWYEYGGRPFHFRVAVPASGRPVLAAEIERVWRTAIGAKNVRSMPEIRYTSENADKLYVGGYGTEAIRIGEFAQPDDVAHVAVGGFSVTHLSIGE